MPGTLRQSYANYFDGLNAPGVSKRVNNYFTTTATPTVWTPASGKKFRILGCSVVATVKTVLATGAGAGELCLLDNAVTAPVLALAGWSATQAAGTSVTLTTLFPYPGIVSTTADNVLKLGFLTSAADGVTSGLTIGTGEILFFGVIWGNEE